MTSLSGPQGHDNESATNVCAGRSEGVLLPSVPSQSPPELSLLKGVGACEGAARQEQQRDVAFVQENGVGAKKKRDGGEDEDEDKEKEKGCDASSFAVPPKKAKVDNGVLSYGA
jgi:hypothetical protein